MFAAPPDVTARVFATLAVELDGGPKKSKWARTQHLGRRFRAFLEGPSFDREGNLFCVDLAYGRIFRVSPEGELELFLEYDGEPNGLKVHRDGRIFIADHRRAFMRSRAIPGMMPR